MKYNTITVCVALFEVLLLMGRIQIKGTSQEIQVIQITNHNYAEIFIFCQHRKHLSYLYLKLTDLWTFFFLSSLLLSWQKYTWRIHNARNRRIRYTIHLFAERKSFKRKLRQSRTCSVHFYPRAKYMRGLLILLSSWWHSESVFCHLSSSIIRCQYNQ